MTAIKGNGLCSNLCDATDDGAKSRRAEFAAKIKEKESLKKERDRKRRYQDVRLQKQEDEEVQIVSGKKKKSKMSQPKLKDLLKSNDVAAADLAVTK